MSELKSEDVNFKISLDDLFDIDHEVDEYFEFDIDPSVFDEEMPIPDVPKLPQRIEPITPSTSHTSREDIETFIQGQENQNTMKKTLSDINKLEKYMAENGENRKLHQIPLEHLDTQIAGFIMTIKKPNGEDYEPSSIRNMISSFDRKLRRHGYAHSIIRSQTNAFNLTRETLKAKMKLLKRDGKGNRPHEAEPLTDEDINMLYDKNLLGIESPSALINSLWLNNSIHFGMRAVTEHHELRWGDVALKSNGPDEYLEFNERQTKTRTGENVSDTRKVRPKIFTTKNATRDPIIIYKQYAENRPLNYNFPDAPFYLAPRTIPVTSVSDQWFLRQRIGKNKLASLLKCMCKAANITDRKLTNHSARKHLVQKLRDNNVPPTEIMQISGHKNVQSVINYSSISIENQKKCSNILANTVSTNKSTNENYLSNENRCSSSCALPQNVPDQRQPLESSGTAISNELTGPLCPVTQAVSSIPPPTGPEQHRDPRSVHIPTLNVSTRNSSVVTPIFYGAVLNVGTLNVYASHSPSDQEI